MLNENKGFGKKQTSVRLQLNEEIVKELKSIPHWQNRLKAILPELIEDWKLDSCEKVIERREQLEEKNWAAFFLHKTRNPCQNASVAYRRYCGVVTKKLGLIEKKPQGYASLR